MTTFISHREGQFTYFDRQLGNPDWTGKRVLDFGGNVGNLLVDPNCKIQPGDYWCFDVSRDAITEGQRRHPEAHFGFYDRYNFQYNPTGTVGLPIPDPGVRFDVIVAFSVFTHNNRADSVEFIRQLRALLAEDGRLAFTFFDPLWRPPRGWANDRESSDLPNLHRHLETMRATTRPEIDVARLLEQADKTALTWVTLVNGNDLIVDPDDAPAERPQWPSAESAHGAYLSYCTPEYLRRLFPDVQIRPPEEPERMHCAIIGPPRGAARR
jgi:SAM-dependent methyltransferase